MPRPTHHELHRTNGTLVLTALLATGSGVAFLGYGMLCLQSATMVREFERFGLARFRILTGVLEVLGGLGLLVGLAWPPALWLASAGLAALMAAGVAVRMRIGDGLTASLPALLLMGVNLYILLASAGG